MTNDSHLDVLYDHDGIVVINKPFGLASQPTRRNEINVYNLMQKLYPYVGLHHRLDRTASGLLLLCSTQKWNKALSDAFQQRKISRGYLAWVLDDPGESGEWKHSLDGKPAHSSFKKLYSDGSQSVLFIQIHSGRKHQIRRQAALSGFPILGDKRYGGVVGQLWIRLALHATTLSFTHPGSKEEVSLYSPIPNDLQGVLGEQITTSIQEKFYSSR
jgi:23S rRNA-/tRNA-specific pseudouridylate synthase